jgi:alcohol dehydrogenase (cytochrome c)
MPTVLGGTNWYPPSFSPKTGLFYVSAWENSKTGGPQAPQTPGARGANTTPMADITLAPNVKTEEEGFGVVRAFDPRTLDQKWEFKMNDITWACSPPQAMACVPVADAKAANFALDAPRRRVAHGKFLWEARSTAARWATPSTASNTSPWLPHTPGTALFTFALRQ